MAFKMKGFSPFTQYDPVKKPVGPVTPSTKAEYMNREVWNLVEKQKAGDFDKSTEYHSFKPHRPYDKDELYDKKYDRANQESPLKQKPKDDDSEKMTPEQEAAHRAKVLEYNKNVAKPMNETQKRKIREQLSKMDPNDPEAKLLRDMLNLKKNKSPMKDIGRAGFDRHREEESPMKQGADAAEMRRYKRYKRTGKISSASKGNERQGMSEEKRFKTYGKMYDDKARGQKEQKKINRQRRRQARFSG